MDPRSLVRPSGMTDFVLAMVLGLEIPEGWRNMAFDRCH